MGRRMSQYGIPGFGPLVCTACMKIMHFHETEPHWKCACGINSVSDHGSINIKHLWDYSIEAQDKIEKNSSIAEVRQNEIVFQVSIQRSTEAGHESVGTYSTLEELPAVMNAWFTRKDIHVMNVKITPMTRRLSEYLEYN